MYFTIISLLSIEFTPPHHYSPFFFCHYLGKKGFLMSLTYKIYTRSGISGSWTEDFTLDLLTVQAFTAPKPGYTRLQRRVGVWRGNQSPITDFETLVESSPIRGKQVKIEFYEEGNGTLFTWYGVCPNEDQLLLGTLTDTEGEISLNYEVCPKLNPEGERAL